MAAQRKYPEELRDRAVKMVFKVWEREGKGDWEIACVARQLGIHPEALRTRIRQAEVDVGTRPGTTTDDKQRIAELERDVRQLRRANEILRGTCVPTDPEELAPVEAEVPTGSMLARTAGLSDRTISLNVTHLEQIRVWFGRPLRERHPVDAYLAS